MKFCYLKDIFKEYILFPVIKSLQFIFTFTMHSIVVHFKDAGNYFITSFLLQFFHILRIMIWMVIYIAICRCRGNL